MIYYIFSPPPYKRTVKQEILNQEVIIMAKKLIDSYSAHASSLIRFLASLILLSSINFHLVPLCPWTCWDFVGLYGHCSSFQVICIAAGLVGGYDTFGGYLANTFIPQKRLHPCLLSGCSLFFWLIFFYSANLFS